MKSLLVRRPRPLPSRPVQRHEVLVRTAGDVYRLALEDIVEFLGPIPTVLDDLTRSDLDGIESAYKRAKDALDDGGA